VKTIEVFDSDYEALAYLAKVNDVDLRAMVGGLVAIGCQTYAESIAAWEKRQKKPKPAKKDRPVRRAKKPTMTEALAKDYMKALALVKAKGKICCADIQRELGLGYNTAARIVDMLIDNEAVVQGTTRYSWVPAE